MEVRRRILIVNYEYPPLGGGGAVQSRHLAEALAKRGHVIHVLTAAWAALAREETLNGVHIHRIPALRRQAGRSNVLEMFSFLRLAWRYAPELARTYDIDIALVYFTLPCGPVGWRLSRTNDIPYVIALMGGDVPGFDPSALRWHHRLTGWAISALWRDAAAVIANAEGLAHLARRHAPTQSVDVIPAGAHLDPVVPRQALDIELLFVGRLVSQKGCDILLAALSGLATHHTWHLTIIGDGPARASLEAAAHRHGLNHRITFTGWRPADDIAQRHADIFVLPSRDEGLPSAVLEAMGRAMPVVATRIGGVPDLVTHGETGLLVPAEDPTSLRAALQRLMEDPALRKRMGDAGRRRIGAHYTWSAAADRWAAVLEKALHAGA